MKTTLIILIVGIFSFISNGQEGYTVTRVNPTTVIVKPIKEDINKKKYPEFYKVCTYSKDNPNIPYFYISGGKQTIFNTPSGKILCNTITQQSILINKYQQQIEAIQLKIKTLSLSNNPTNVELIQLNNLEKIMNTVAINREEYAIKLQLLATNTQ